MDKYYPNSGETQREQTESTTYVENATHRNMQSHEFKKKGYIHNINHDILCEHPYEQYQKQNTKMQISKEMKILHKIKQHLVVCILYNVYSLYHFVCEFDSNKFLFNLRIHRTLQH